MSDYRYQIVDHHGILSLHIMIDAGELLEQYESPECDGILTTHIPINDIETSIRRYRKEQEAMGGRPNKGTRADKRLKENQPPKPPVKKG